MLRGRAGERGHTPTLQTTRKPRQEEQYADVQATHRPAQGTGVKGLVLGTVYLRRLLAGRVQSRIIKEVKNRKRNLVGRKESRDVIVSKF